MYSLSKLRVAGAPWLHAGGMGIIVELFDISLYIFVCVMCVFVFLRERQAHLPGPGPDRLQHAAHCHLPEADEAAVHDAHREGECSRMDSLDKQHLLFN